MPVTVRIQKDRQDHATAGHVAVNNGHLYVMQSSSPHAATVAVYAPGAWTSAIVGDVAADEPEEQTRVIVG